MCGISGAIYTQITDVETEANGLLTYDREIIKVDVDRVAALIRKVSANRTVLMVEHNLSVVSTLSDHITVLARGEVLAKGDYASVSRNPAVIEAYLGGVHA